MGPFDNLDQLGDLVSTIGSRDFGRAFYSVFRNLLDAEDCTVFSFAPEHRPERLLVEGASDDRRENACRLASDYVAGGYLNDPNMRQMAAPTTVYTLESDEIGDSDYRAHYYETLALGHELVMLGHEGDTVYYTSFYRRKEAAGFSRHDVDTAGKLANFVVKSLHRHRELVQSGNDDSAPVHDFSLGVGGHQRDRTLSHLKDVLLGGSHRLSPREAEVCAGIVLGYSTMAISLNCSITPNTVATHRKRAYAKLGISSQNELFARYFTTVRTFQLQRAN